MRVNKISFPRGIQSQNFGVTAKVNSLQNFSENNKCNFNAVNYIPSILFQASSGIATDEKSQTDEIKNSYIEKFDPVTGNLLKGISYRDDGKTVECVEDYDPVSLNKIKETGYFDDGKTVSYTYDYDPENEDLLKATYYYDGKAIEILAEYESKNGVSHIIKETHYRRDGKTVNYIIDFDPSTANVLCTTYYKADGITVDRVEKTL